MRSDTKKKHFCKFGNGGESLFPRITKYVTGNGGMNSGITAHIRKNKFISPSETFILR